MQESRKPKFIQQRPIRKKKSQKTEKEYIANEVYDIQFFTRKKDKGCGLSIRGLATICVEKPGEMQRILDHTRPDRTQKHKEIGDKFDIIWLETDRSKTPYGAKIVHYITCKQVIEYYAKKNPKTAEFNLKLDQHGAEKFIHKMSGFDNYVKQKERELYKEELSLELEHKKQANFLKIINSIQQSQENINQLIQEQKRLTDFNQQSQENINQLIQDQKRVTDCIFAFASEIAPSSNKKAEFLLIKNKQSPSLSKSSHLRLLPSPPILAEKTIQLLPKKEYYDVNNDNIPLQYLSETFQYRLTGSSYPLGRNNFYQILKEEGVMEQNSCKIRFQFLNAGYFFWQKVKMPSGVLRDIQFCSPKGWQWLDRKLKTEWSKYFL